VEFLAELKAKAGKSKKRKKNATPVEKHKHQRRVDSSPALQEHTAAVKEFTAAVKEQSAMFADMLGAVLQELKTMGQHIVTIDTSTMVTADETRRVKDVGKVIAAKMNQE
jgi:hypothetical protein